jgi:hypothetical protein
MSRTSGSSALPSQALSGCSVGPPLGIDVPEETPSETLSLCGAASDAASMAVSIELCARLLAGWGPSICEAILAGSARAGAAGVQLLCSLCVAADVVLPCGGARVSLVSHGASACRGSSRRRFWRSVSSATLTATHFHQVKSAPATRPPTCSYTSASHRGGTGGHGAHRRAARQGQCPPKTARSASGSGQAPRRPLRPRPSTAPTTARPTTMSMMVASQGLRAARGRAARPASQTTSRGRPGPRRLACWQCYPSSMP